MTPKFIVVNDEDGPVAISVETIRWFSVNPGVDPNPRTGSAIICCDDEQWEVNESFLQVADMIHQTTK